MVLAIFIPYVQLATDSTVSKLDTDKIGEDINEDVLKGDFNTLTYISKVAKALFWSFDDIPLWLNSLFFILRVLSIMFLITILPFFG